MEYDCGERTLEAQRTIVLRMPRPSVTNSRLRRPALTDSRLSRTSNVLEFRMAVLFAKALGVWPIQRSIGVGLPEFRELNSRIEVQPTVWRPQPDPGSEIPQRICRGPAQAGLRLRRPGRCQPTAEQDSSRYAAPTTAPTALGRA